MNNTLKLNKRTLRTTNGLKNQVLNPFDLSLINNSNNTVCLNKLNYNNNKFNYYNTNICNNNNNNNFIKKNIYIPHVTINCETLLNIYKLNNIDDIETYINNILKELDINFYHINRILMCWIRLNFNNLKTYLNIIERIYIKIIYIYLNLDYDDDENIEKKIKKYIKYWIKKNKSDIFRLDLFTDFILYYKKYLSFNNDIK
jgi:hypothetical protein